MLSIKRPQTWSDFWHILNGIEPSFLKLGLSDSSWSIATECALPVFEEVCIAVNRSPFWRIRLDLENALGLEMNEKIIIL